MQQKRLLETVKTAFVGDEYGIRQPRKTAFPVPEDGLSHAKRPSFTASFAEKQNNINLFWRQKEQPILSSFFYFDRNVVHSHFDTMLAFR